MADAFRLGLLFSEALVSRFGMVSVLLSGGLVFWIILWVIMVLLIYSSRWNIDRVLSTNAAKRSNCLWLLYLCLATHAHISERIFFMVHQII
jgi:hypothetical protein